MIDIEQFLESDKVVSNHTFDQTRFDTDEKRLFATWFKILHGYYENLNDALDESFNRIIDEPLTNEKFIEVINNENNQRLTPYIVDSLKRYHALNDIHRILSECAKLNNKIIDTNIGEMFEDLIDTITTRMLLTITIENMSHESQRFLANFIKKNDLPIPFTYYIWNPTDNNLYYKINFNCLIEPLCLTTDRLCLQYGSKQCSGLGKTSLLPFIFNDKRKNSLFTDGEKVYRNSCIDVLFGNTKTNSYTIFDVHGEIDEKNISLIKVIQVYAALQIVYVTENDLTNALENPNDDFLHTIMNYSVNSSSIPTIIVIFNSDFDKEEKTQQLINRFQNHYSNQQWSNIYWLSSPTLATINNLNKTKKTRLTSRLKNQFNELLEEIDRKTTSEYLTFRSCFSIQELYLNLKEQNFNTEIQSRPFRFNIEYKLEELFESKTDQTENLKIMTPTSYYRSEIDTIRKQKLSDANDDSKRIEKLDQRLKQLETEKIKESQLTDYSKFMMDLLNNQSYIDLLITEIFFEKWRLKYVPKIKEERENLKKQMSSNHEDLIKQQELVDKERKSKGDKIDEKLLDDLNKLRSKDEKSKNKLLIIDKKLSNVDLTIGLLCDELFALYDYFHDQQPTNLDRYHEDFINAAKNIAKLVHKGFAIHILRSRPLICQSRLMDMTLKYLCSKPNNRLAVLTVVGEQSSAKSSLLNSTFGCNFRVSAGRCTIGMYLGIVHHKNLTLVILDTEGLMSLEESGSIFDNQMVTMAVLTSHLVLINHKGELSSTLEGLIGMSLYAKLQIQSLPFKPKLLFVLRDQTSREPKTFSEQLHKFKDNLHKSSTFLKVSIDNELDIKQENVVLLPSAFSEDINEDLNITQRWRNQTFAYDINQLRKHIFQTFDQQFFDKQFGFINFDALYNSLSSNWKTINDLGQTLLECKSLAELKVMNELKSLAKKIIQKTSNILLIEGTNLLNNLLKKLQEQYSNNNNTDNIVLFPNINISDFSQDGFNELENLTLRLIKDAINEYERNTQQSYYVDLKSKIQKNIEPSIRYTQQSLKQHFDEDIYTISKENAILQAQRQLLYSEKMFFDQPIDGKADLNELNEVLNKRHDELKKEFEHNLSLLKKSSDEITKTILNIYNNLIRSRVSVVDQNDIFNRCPTFDVDTFHKTCENLDIIVQSIQSYFSQHQKTYTNNIGKIQEYLSNFFKKSPWQQFNEKLNWFESRSDVEHNKIIFLDIVEKVIPQLNSDVNRMLSTMKLSYDDPELISMLIQYVNNSMMNQTSPIQQYWKSLYIPRITADLLRITLRFLIVEANQIADRKHQKLLKKLDELSEWKESIHQQFVSSKDSFEQGLQFKIDLQKQIIDEIIKVQKRIIIDNINEKITNNNEIDPEKIAVNAYNESIGSNPPNPNNIMKYILDINRYYLELALNKIKTSKDTIVTNQILLLKEIVYACVDIAVNTVKNHPCNNVQEVYQAIVKDLRRKLPRFLCSPMIGISMNIKDPIRFKQCFEKLLLARDDMYATISKHKNEFDRCAIESCKDLIKRRLGCQIRCPGCGTKCDNTDINHSKHNSSRHLTMAFHGWNNRLTHEPYLSLCYQDWLTSIIYIGDEVFYPARKYYLERASEWFDDLEQKSKIGEACNDNQPPQEQRRAWMAVRHALVKYYSSRKMIDCTNYDSQFYPNIKSVAYNFTPTWDAITS